MVGRRGRVLELERPRGCSAAKPLRTWQAAQPLAGSRGGCHNRRCPRWAQELDDKKKSRKATSSAGPKCTPACTLRTSHRNGMHRAAHFLDTAPPKRGGHL